jgi:hypothetical protein
VSLATTLAVVAAASRVNRLHAPAEPIPEPALEEVIADVDLNTRTLRTVVRSLSTQTHTRARLVVDERLSRAMEEDEAGAGWLSTDPPVTQRFRDVRLGALLSRVADQWGSGMPLSWRVQGATITLHPLDASGPNERRVYSIQTLTRDWRRWQARTTAWRPPPEPPRYRGRGGGGGGGGGLFGGAPPTDQQRMLGELLETFRRHFDYDGRWQLETPWFWAGWLIVEGPPDMHEQLERFLAMLQSDAAGAGGGDGGAR